MIKFLKSILYFSGNGNGSLFIMELIIVIKFSASNGLFNVQSSYKIQPKLHISALLSYGYPRQISGAI